MGVKMGWIQIKMGHPLARNGAALTPFRANRAHPSCRDIFQYPINYPPRACAARGKVISRRWWVVVVSIKKKNLQFFWNQSFISQNTQFQRSVLTHI